MKKYLSFLIPIGLIVLIFVLAGFGGDELKNSSGAPPGYTNSPADGQNCSHCMGGSATAVTGWITSDVPATGYVPGNTYTITVTVPGAGNKGFEVSPQTLTGTLIGTMTAGTGNKLTGSGKYVTHSAAKSANPAVWTFQWTPPAGGAGDVTFYGSMAITQPVTKTTTLTVSQSTVGIPELTGMDWSFYPNPAHGKIFFKYAATQSKAARIDLLSNDGKVVSNLLTATLPAGTGDLEFGLSQPAGLYLLRMTAETGTQVKKIIIQ